MLDNVVVRTIRVQDITLGSYVVTDLNHETRYAFSASLVNTAGLSASYSDEAITTIGRCMENISMLTKVLSKQLVTESQNM